MIFLDTDIISYYFSGNVKIKEKISELIEKEEKIAITIINVYEILKGLRYNNNKQLEREFRELLENINVYSIDEDVILIAADVSSILRKKGKTIGDADILIAAIVMTNNGILVSNNTKHYENISRLNLINWNLKIAPIFQKK